MVSWRCGVGCAIRRLLPLVALFTALWCLPCSLLWADGVSANKPVDKPALAPDGADRHAAVILVLGDSISAGYGVEDGRGWVALLRERLAREGYAYRVVNASISGDTTDGGRARLPAALRRYDPVVVIIELGGNDGLRGLPLSRMQANLEAMVGSARRAGARVLLLGLRLPPNYGPVYIGRFHAVFEQVSHAAKVPLVPYLLAGVDDRPALMQADGIHPTAAAQGRLLDNVWGRLQTLLGTPHKAMARP